MIKLQDVSKSFKANLAVTNFNYILTESRGELIESRVLFYKFLNYLNIIL